MSNREQAFLYGPSRADNPTLPDKRLEESGNIKVTTTAINLPAGWAEKNLHIPEKIKEEIAKRREVAFPTVEEHSKLGITT